MAIPRYNMRRLLAIMTTLVILLGSPFILARMASELGWERNFDNNAREELRLTPRTHYRPERTREGYIQWLDKIPPRKLNPQGGD